jgi:hypothetical protein
VTDKTALAQRKNTKTILKRKYESRNNLTVDEVFDRVIIKRTPKDQDRDVPPKREFNYNVPFCDIDKPPLED